MPSARTVCYMTGPTVLERHSYNICGLLNNKEKAHDIATNIIFWASIGQQYFFAHNTYEIAYSIQKDLDRIGCISSMYHPSNWLGPLVLS